MRLFLTVPVALLAGCLNNDRQTEQVLDYEGPGSEAWGEVDVTCGTTGDCLTGESCIDGICQVEKCTANLDASSAPVGETLRFFQESELAVADTSTYDGAYWIDGYATDGNLAYDYSWEVGGSSITDVTGGDFTGNRPDNYVTISSNASELTLLTSSGKETVSLGFRPTNVDAGDVDGDGLDEAVAVAEDGTTAICDMERNSCEGFSFSSPLTVHDVAVGDIDGDTRAEIVYLVESEGYRYLYGYNVDAEETGQIEGWWHYPGDDNDNPVRITIGDLDGDRVAEVIGLWNDWCYDFCDDEIRVWTPIEGSDGVGEFSEIASGVINNYPVTTDIVVADTDLDEEAEIYILADEARVIEMTLGSSGVNLRGASQLDVSAAPDRIAAADHDGDAPRARQKGEPEKVEGAVMPIMLMTIPPYSADFSDGPGRVGYGDGESTSESLTDSVSMGLSVDVGTKADFWGIFEAKLSSKVSWYTTTSTTETSALYMGSRYTIEAQPELYGPNYGGVVLSWGCFDAYTYEVDDPKQNIGSVDEEEFVMIVPTGGGVSLWSTDRYNAMAEAVGGLPIMEIPYTVGDVSSYPSSPERLDGSELETSDMLFSSPEKYTVSDVGHTSWWNSVTESSTNASNMSTDVGASVGVTVAGVSFGLSGSYGWGQGYSITVGNNAMFNGTLPAIPDNPNTPEDEYSQHRYSATPYVYLQDYQDVEGNDAAYWVMTYTAEQ